MYSIVSNDVNDVLCHGLNLILRDGVESSSRNGTVLVLPKPVCVEYTNPRNRVLYSPTRDANPFFHLMEAMWMLSGSNDVEFVEYFAKQMMAYSDDGITAWGGYGWRWRSFFGWDQLEGIIEELKANPTSRRCVLSMWNASPAQAVWRTKVDKYGTIGTCDDFYVATHGGLDVPCNTHAYLDCRNDKLNITVCNRSNDFLWGLAGANAVQFSFLLEYMAMRIGIPVGSYFQFTNNCHAYTSVFNSDKMRQIADESYTLGKMPATGPALEPGFDADLGMFMRWAREVIRQETPPATIPAGSPAPQAWEAAFNVPDTHTVFMTDVVIPMFLAWVYRKWKDTYSMNLCLNAVEAPDWKRAAWEWVDRRENKK